MSNTGNSIITQVIASLLAAAIISGIGFGYNLYAQVASLEERIKVLENIKPAPIITIPKGCDTLAESYSLLVRGNTTFLSQFDNERLDALSKAMEKLGCNSTSR